MVLPESDSEALKNFMSLAANYDDIKFAHVFNKDLVSSLEV